jgi:hypothetical protein
MSSNARQSRGGSRVRKLDNIAIIVFGVLMIVVSPVCLWGSSVFNEELSRWQAARFIQEAGELATIPEGSDVAIVGSIPPDAAAPREGFAIYEVWELTYGVGESERKWRVTGGHKPVFGLLLGEQGVAIQSARATLYNTREVGVSHEERLEGLTPGSEITILGTLSSSQESFEVQAEVICGGGRDQCLGQFSRPSIILVVVTVVLILAGIGLVWFGLRRLRA